MLTKVKLLSLPILIILITIFIATAAASGIVTGLTIHLPRQRVRLQRLLPHSWLHQVRRVIPPSNLPSSPIQMDDQSHNWPNYPQIWLKAYRPISQTTKHHKTPILYRIEFWPA